MDGLPEGNCVIRADDQPGVEGRREWQSVPKRGAGSTAHLLKGSGLLSHAPGLIKGNAGYNFQRPFLITSHSCPCLHLFPRYVRVHEAPSARLTLCQHLSPMSLTLSFVISKLGAPPSLNWQAKLEGLFGKIRHRLSLSSPVDTPLIPTNSISAQFRSLSNLSSAGEELPSNLFDKDRSGCPTLATDNQSGQRWVRFGFVFICISGMTMPSPNIIGLNGGCVDNRKASKPLIEKRRRARINRSLGELRSIVVPTPDKNLQMPVSL
ncbi:unnamed protein product [Larinioides sclopetarius]|uniref:BHLH domain-containing protein n=1 Tax=Larinioides sclopetarius TaxID=280406 RepID=A0AAV2B5I9_9ARAC